MWARHLDMRPMAHTHNDIPVASSTRTGVSNYATPVTSPGSEADPSMKSRFLSFFGLSVLGVGGGETGPGARSDFLRTALTLRRIWQMAVLLGALLCPGGLVLAAVCAAVCRHNNSAAAVSERRLPRTWLPAIARRAHAAVQ